MDEKNKSTIFSIGDSALTIELGTAIDAAVHQRVMALFHQIKQKPILGVVEAIPAYASLTLVYDIEIVQRAYSIGVNAFEKLKHVLGQYLTGAIMVESEDNRLIEIPVCYGSQYGKDLLLVAGKNKISEAEVVQIHSSKIYTVYMLGFLPGFAYLSKINEAIQMPRKLIPEPVLAGSVGIAGLQTGIYPLNSPGGWQIIGRTPLKLFDAEKEPTVLLQPGDSIKFKPITENEFKHY